jgi:hypothetical protein
MFNQHMMDESVHARGRERVKEREKKWQEKARNRGTYIVNIKGRGCRPQPTILIACGSDLAHPGKRGGIRRVERLEGGGGGGGERKSWEEEERKGGLHYKSHERKCAHDIRDGKDDKSTDVMYVCKRT